MISPEREAEIRRKTRAAVAWYVKQDLEGDELLIKEVNEEMKSVEESEIVQSELKSIVWLLEDEDRHPCA